MKRFMYGYIIYMYLKGCICFIYNNIVMDMGFFVYFFFVKKFVYMYIYKCELLFFNCY